MNLRECFDRHKCDRGGRHGYERVYEPLFSPIRERNLRILEIGIYKGAGISSWLDYFPNATIFGVDTFQRINWNSVAVLKNPRVQWAEMNTADNPEWVIRAANALEEIGDNYDIIFDDGSHDSEAQRLTFLNFFPKLSPEGYYFIEDVFPDNYDTRKLYEAVTPYKAHDLRTKEIRDSLILEIRKC